MVVATSEDRPGPILGRILTAGILPPIPTQIYSIFWRKIHGSLYLLFAAYFSKMEEKSNFLENNPYTTVGIPFWFDMI
jgi:hypothetical protein